MTIVENKKLDTILIFKLKAPKKDYYFKDSAFLSSSKGNYEE